MLTKPNTTGREREVDDILSDIRRKLIKGDFASVTCTYDFEERECQEAGKSTRHLTGGFSLIAVPTSTAKETE